MLQRSGWRAGRRRCCQQQVQGARTLLTFDHGSRREVVVRGPLGNLGLVSAACSHPDRYQCRGIGQLAGARFSKELSLLPLV